MVAVLGILSEAIVEEAWLRTLSRPPLDEEKKQFVEMLKTAQASERRELVEDLYWSLLTSREFLFRH